MPKLHVSYKPQRITPKSTCTVRQLLHKKIPDSYVHPQFTADVMKPLKIPELFDQQVCFYLQLKFISIYSVEFMISRLD